MISRRARETSSDAIESIVLKNPYVIPEIVSPAPVEVI